MSDMFYKKNPKTMKAAKITEFFKEQAGSPEEGSGKYFVALFENSETKASSGWYTNNKRHALNDAKAWVK